MIFEIKEKLKKSLLVSCVTQCGFNFTAVPPVSLIFNSSLDLSLPVFLVLSWFVTHETQISHTYNFDFFNPIYGIFFSSCMFSLYIIMQLVAVCYYYFLKQINANLFGLLPTESLNNE